MVSREGNRNEPASPGRLPPVYGRSRLNDAMYAVSRVVSRCASFVLLDVETEGTAHVPREGPALLAATHQSFLDPWLIGQVIERQSYYFARESLFRLPVLRWLLPRYHCLPVPRGGVAARRALEYSIEVVRKGQVLLLFPEGTRTADGSIQVLKRGLALVVKRTGAPVVPIVIQGAFEAWPRQAKWPRLGFFPRLWRRRPNRIRLLFGEPLHLEEGESGAAFMARLDAAYRHLAGKDLASSVEGRGRSPHALATPAGHAPRSKEQAKEQATRRRAEGDPSGRASTFYGERASLLEAAGARPAGPPHRSVSLTAPPREAARDDALGGASHHVFPSSTSSRGGH